MRFEDTRWFKGMVILLIATGNVAFYTWGYPESGAKYAWEISPWFAGMIQGLFLYALLSYIYFFKTGE